eukprot:901000-Amphidinium_carterae.1
MTPAECRQMKSSHFLNCQTGQFRPRGAHANFDSRALLSLARQKMYFAKAGGFPTPCSLSLRNCALFGVTQILWDNLGVLIAP